MLLDCNAVGQFGCWPSDISALGLHVLFSPLIVIVIVFCWSAYNTVWIVNNDKDEQNNNIPCAVCCKPTDGNEL